MRTINANAVRGRSYENFFTRKFIIRKFLYTKISRSTVIGICVHIGLPEPAIVLACGLFCLNFHNLGIFLTRGKNTYIQQKQHIKFCLHPLLSHYLIWLRLHYTHLLHSHNFTVAIYFSVALGSLIH